MPQPTRTATFPMITHNLVVRIWKPEEFTPDQMVMHFSKLAVFERYTKMPVSLEVTRALKDASYAGLTQTD